MTPFSISRIRSFLNCVVSLVVFILAFHYAINLHGIDVNIQPQRDKRCNVPLRCA